MPNTTEKATRARVIEGTSCFLGMIGHITARKANGSVLMSFPNKPYDDYRFWAFEIEELKMSSESNVNASEFCACGDTVPVFDKFEGVLAYPQGHEAERCPDAAFGS